MKQFPRADHIIAEREWEWLSTLGPEVCPAIIGRVPDGYIMEELVSIRNMKALDYLPTMVLGLLEEKVWSQAVPDLVPSEGGPDKSWTDHLSRIFSVDVPGWVLSSAGRAQTCSHGDPSFSNVMLHPTSLDLRLIDPCHRDYTPSTWGVDAGKILQSCLGWEQLQAGWDPVDYLLPTSPLFEGDNLRVSLWWAGMHAIRIYRRESGARRRPEVLEWADHVAQECHHAVGV